MPSLHAGSNVLESVAAWLLGILWVLPLVYAFWTAFHPPEFSTRFDLTAPWTLTNSDLLNGFSPLPLPRIPIAPRSRRCWHWRGTGKAAPPMLSV